MELVCGSKRTRRSPSHSPPPRSPPPPCPFSRAPLPSEVPIPSRQTQIPMYPPHSNFSPLLQQTLVYQAQPPNQPLYVVLPPLLPGAQPPPIPLRNTNLTIPRLPSRPVRPRRNQSQVNRIENREKTIPPPYPWATNRPAFVHKASYLLERQILTITGTVRCAKCERDFEVGLDLKDALFQVYKFIAKNINDLNDRAPNEWMTPTLLTCKFCSRETARPVISENKERINWLFLFLGQLLGCCTLEQLKYFCGCTQNHRTGAKDRVLYLTYLDIWKQLHPEEVHW